MTQTSGLSRVYPVLVFALSLLFTTCLVNLNGGDWDGVQIVLGSVFHDAAVQGHTVLYRPEWQPLTFGLLRLVYAWTHSVEACMFLPAVLGAAGITFWLGAMRKLSSGRLPLLLLAGILLLIPEILFGAIYMNSTVFGVPFAAAAMWLAAEDWLPAGRSGRRYVQNFLVGVFLAVACLCRLEFLLAGPMFLFLLVRTRPSRLVGRLVALMFGGAVVFAAAYVSGVLDWKAALQIVRGHQAGASPEGAHYYYNSVKVLLAILGMNLFAWLMAGFGAVQQLWATVRSRRWFDLLVVLPLAVLLYPVPSITTPKYLVPLYLFIGMFLAWLLAQPFFMDKRRPVLVSVAMMVAVMLACFLPIHPSRGSGVHLTTQTWRGTDDGPRSFWGYAFALREVSSLQEAPGLPPAGRWLDAFTDTADELVVLTPYDGWVSNASVSQPYVFHLARNFPQIEIGPDHVWAVAPGKKVLIAEPASLQKSLDRYFAQAARPPQQAAIPLNVPPEEMALLKQMATGATSETGLTAQTGGNREMVVTTLKALVRRGLIRPAGPGNYQIRYHLREFDSGSR